MGDIPRDAAVLITGCSSGLGRATALAFLADGRRVVATARRPADIADLAARGCETLALDVTDEASRAAAVAAVEARHGAVGVLVNNAGFGHYGPLEEIALDDVRRSFETNVFGLLRMAQLVLPGMRAAGRGRIINVSSLAGRLTMQGGGLYHMTKHAVESLADALRPEVAPFGVDVVNILPGPIASNYAGKAVSTVEGVGPQGPYGAYRRGLARYLTDFFRPGRFGVMTADAVARVILTAGTVARPRPRYRVGLYARFAPLGRAMIPDRLVDAITSRDIRKAAGD